MAYHIQMWQRIPVVVPLLSTMGTEHSGNTQRLRENANSRFTVVLFGSISASHSGSALGRRALALNLSGLGFLLGGLSTYRRIIQAEGMRDYRFDQAAGVGVGVEPFQLR